MLGRHVVRMTALAVVALVSAASLAVGGGAPAPPGSTGHDVSYPQCTGQGSTSATVGSLGGQFGISGVTDGLPWSSNPCLASEFTWASGLPDEPGLYANTANPAPKSSFYWPASGASDPALCRDSTSTTDPGCAYDYGWHAAADALGTAQAAVPGAGTLPWWLDVETANSWNGDGTSNTADLQGAVDYLRSNGVPAVGIYSSAGAWNTITGGYTVTTASTYQAAWAPEFTPLAPLSGSPTWVSGAGTSAAASSTCAAAAFTGTVPGLAQYSDGTGVDADLVCGSAPAQSFAVTLNPTSGSAPPGGSTTATVAVAESGAAQTVGLSASGQPSGVTVAFSPASLSAPGSSSMTVTVAGAVPPGTYPVTVSATGESGSQTVPYTLTVAAATQSVAVTLSPTSGSVKPGGSKQATVTVTEQGAAQAVTLTAGSSPAGPAMSFTPSRLSGPGSATLTIATTRSVRPGTYAITVTADGSAGSGASAIYTLTALQNTRANSAGGR